MKEITLKEWCEMLGFGIKIEILNYKQDYVGIQFSDANGFYILNNEIHITYDGGSTGKSNQSCKPILRDLSDLTKETTHDGEKFVPIDYFLGNDDDDILNAVQIKDLSYLPYNLIQKLLEWKFNVFQLPDKLIVKVTPEFNPYK